MSPEMRVSSSLSCFSNLVSWVSNLLSKSAACVSNLWLNGEACRLRINSRSEPGFHRRVDHIFGSELVYLLIDNL